MALPSNITSGDGGKSGVTGKKPVLKKTPAWMTTGNVAAHYATNADLAAAQTMAQKQAKLAQVSGARLTGAGDASLNSGLQGGGVHPAASAYATPSTVSAGGGPSSMSSGGGAASPSAASAGGYAGKYRTGLESTVAYDNPEILANDVLKSMGINDPTLASMLASDANFASLAAFLTNAPKGDATTTSDSGIVNFMGNYFKNQASVGGAGPNTSGLVSSILGANSDQGGQIDKYLTQYITANDPQALTKTTDLVNNTLQNTLNDQNPYTQRATKSMLAQQATDYIAAQAHGGNPGNYTDYLKKSPLGNWF